MRVKMRSLGAGPDGPRHPGVELTVPQAEGEQLVKGGYADALPDPDEVETAEEPEDHETAVTADPKGGKGRGRGRRG